MAVSYTHLDVYKRQAYNLIGGSSSLTGVFANVFSIVLMLVLPILTMRLFSDEKRQRTDQALLTAPVSLTSIVLGKFFAALLIFALGSCIMLVYAVIISFQVSPDWVVILGNYVGMLLLLSLIHIWGRPSLSPVRR